MTEKKKKKVITIYYNPKELPEIEVYFYSEEIEQRDESFEKANHRMRIILSEIYQIVKYLGFGEDIVKKRYIQKLGEPHIIPVIYINGVLFATIYTFDPNKFFEIMKKMKEMRDRYYANLYRNINRGFVIYPDEDFIHLRNPMYVNKIVSVKDLQIAKELGLLESSLEPYDELPVTDILIKELDKLGVIITNLGFKKGTKWTVLYIPESKPIEK